MRFGAGALGCGRRLGLVLLGWAAATFAFAGQAQAVTFEANAGSLGAIPDGSSCSTSDGWGAPKNVTFDVTGVSEITNVVVGFTASHHFLGDLEATLIAPDGTRHVLFSRTGATNQQPNGSPRAINGTYRFSDLAAAQPSGGWWAATTQDLGNPVALGTYRTSEPGGAGTNPSGPETAMTPVFDGMASAAGTWTLRFRDRCIAYTGSVSAAWLMLEGTSDPASFGLQTFRTGDQPAGHRLR